MLEPIFTEEEEERGMTLPGVQDLLNEKVGSLSTFQTIPKCAQKILLESARGEDSPLVKKILDAVDTVSALRKNVNLTYHMFFNRPILPTCHQLTKCLHILWHPLKLRR